MQETIAAQPALVEALLSSPPPGTYDETLAAELTPAGPLVTDLADPNLVDRRLAGLLAG